MDCVVAIATNTVMPNVRVAKRFAFGCFLSLGRGDCLGLSSSRMPRQSYLDLERRGQGPSYMPTGPLGRFHSRRLFPRWAISVGPFERPYEGQPSSYKHLQAG